MKKTLLCFLLLFSNFFYAQVTSITICPSESFNLNILKADFIGNLNPAETTVTYFLSEADALNNTNAIANPTNYHGPAGTIKIYGRIDNNGTITSNYFNLTTFPSTNVSASNKPILCKGDTGTLSINASGGSGSYSYSINGGPFTNQDYYPIMPAGFYSISVLDNVYGCKTSINYTITEPSVLVATALVDRQNVIVTATGGTAPYQYSLDGINFQSASFFSNLSPGSYNIRVRDSNGCATLVSTTVNYALTSNLTIVKMIDCISNGILAAYAIGGQPPYLYSINGGAYSPTNGYNDLPAGTYIVTAKDATNTISYSNTITLAPPAPVDFNVVNTPILCSGGMASLTITAFAGQAPYQYAINEGASTNNNVFNNLTAGNYTIKVTDALGCVKIRPYTITEPIALTATSSTFGQNIVISTTGGKAPYLYALDGVNFQDSNVFSDVVDGTYSVIIKDAQGCSFTLSVKLSAAEQPLSSGAMIVKQVDCRGNGALRVIGYGGQPPYLYSIDGAQTFQTSDTFNNLVAGVYPVAVKDAQNTVVNNLSMGLKAFVPVTGNAVVTNSASCLNNGKIEVSGNGGQIPLYYSIDGGVTYKANNTFTNLPAGNYTILVKDSGDCISPAISATIQQPAQLGVTATSTSILCHNGASNLTISVTGGQVPYQYAINNDSYTSINVFTNLKAGNYVIKVKDALGCINALPYTITEPSVVDAEMVIDDNTISLLDVKGGTGTYFYALDNSNFQTNNVFTNVSTGTHTVRVKDSNDCEPGVFTAIIPVKLTTIASITKPLECTSKAEITVTATGGFTPYVYSINGGATFQASNIFTNVAAGNYTIITKDNDNKLSSQSIVIDQLMPIYPDIIIDGSTITINGQAGTAPYLYSLDLGPFQSNNVFTNLSTGQHHVYIKDSKGCESFGFMVHIENVNQLVATAVLTKEIDCMSNAVIVANAIGGTAPYTYSINGVSFQSANVFSNLSVGTYSITVKDANGNLATTSNLMVVPANLPVIYTTQTNVSCFQATDGMISVLATGGKAPFVYALDNSAFFPTNVFANLAAGDYNVTIKDANGCLSSSYVRILQPNAITQTVSVKNSTTVGSNDGQITVTAIGGFAPYVYALTDASGPPAVSFQASNTFGGLKAGSYNVQVKDANGCMSIQTVLIVDGPAPLLATATATQITCTNPSGIITVTATGGTPPYTYSFDNGITYSVSNTYNGFPGNYLIKAKDAQNTVATTTITLVTPTPVVSTAILIKAVDCTSNATVMINAAGGTGAYVYSINGSPYSPNSVFTNLAPGTYQFNVRDNGDCVSTNSLVIEPLVSLTATATNTPVLCRFETSSITITALGGKAPYRYSLSSDVYTNTNTFTEVSTGTYNIKVKDANDCIFTLPYTIAEPTKIRGRVAFDGTTATVLDVSGGSGTYLYSLNDGELQTSNVFTNIGRSGQILVYDSFGCFGFGVSFNNQEPNAIKAQITIVKTIDCVSNGSISITASGGESPYEYSINGGTNYQTSNIFSNLTAGTYTVWVKDAKGSINSENSVTILQPTLLSLSNVVANSKTLNSVDGKITITASGGTAPYQYVLKYENGSQIVGPQTSPIFEGLSVGKYTIEVTDSAGCKTSKSGILVTSDTIFGTLMTTPITCTSLGRITINAAGGKYPHQYSFDNGITYGTSNIASNLQAGTYNIKVKDAGGDILALSTTLTGVNPLIVTAAITSPIHCKGSNDAVIQIAVSGGKAPYLYSLNRGSYQANSIFSNLPAGTHEIAVKDSNECLSIMMLTITEPIALIATVDVVNQNITVNATGGAGGYRYAISPNLNQFSVNNIFSNLSPGIYSVITSDLNGCYVIMDVVVDPIAPTINGQSNKMTVEFKSGQTLADLTIDGQDIKWYSTPGSSSSGKTNKSTAETPLPLTTVLVDGTTYYASQTINGIESKERLAVTAKVNGSLSAPDFNLTTFQFYPNPVIDILTIENNSVIDDVEIIDVSGKSVVFKKINDLHSEIDLSNLSSGVYILKVKSENRQKTVKFIKK
ncbi:Por secretion system C-terminal sorting domain-containing protein [Flavobacterium resistens]|uniref:Por secretion system C-terminal sorting domain-containing protein n=1 Tax=Flavobacterium resistens TaxID=443612 RepID=A0A521C7Y7_9FLAO|nr:T9SS type A sorting domain-containing protein [Flavobacterium resistens]MRX66399.1 T9SS type A sorting domain-containing protein [Flavobacterium resistens]SMO55549.1 Por secretion system C-terminal sorting domain-containing protein [Flavobacterium resistens]